MSIVIINRGSIYPNGDMCLYKSKYNPTNIYLYGELNYMKGRVGANKYIYPANTLGHSYKRHIATIHIVYKVKKWCIDYFTQDMYYNGYKI